MDKRGRPIDLSTNEDLKKYYHLVDDEEESADEPEKSIEKKDEDEDRSSSADSQSEQEEDEIEGNIKESDIRSTTKLSKTLQKKLRDENVDYARGEQPFVAEESSDDSSSTEDDEEEEDTTHGTLFEVA